ncbi:MAG: S-adenosylmethionine decarboxylase [Pseudomonadota bacterium]
MQGLHLTADLHNCRCDPAWLSDAQQLADWSQGALQSLGLAPASQLFQGFAGPDGKPGGLSAAVVLPGAHLAMHSRLAQKAVILDVCITDAVTAHAAIAQQLMQLLAERFSPEWTEQRSLDRGDES